MKKYNPRKHWWLRSTKPGIGGYLACFVFESRAVQAGSRAVREVYADSEEEAWSKLKPPRF